MFDIETLITGWRPYAALSVLCALLFLPGLNNLPPTDRDEARFMQATKQMLETKDVVTIRFQSDLRTKKPVGIHWLQYAAVKYLADRDLQAVWAYRLPSAVCAWLAVLVTFAFGARAFNRETALTGAAVMACTFLLVAEAHIAKTDAALLLTVVCAQACLYWLYCTPPGHSPPMRLTIGFWMAIGAGLLIKGPITPGIALLTMAVLCIAERRTDWLRRLQPELGVPVAAAFILPWTLASAVAGNGDVIAASLTEDFLPKLLGGVESHGAPPGTHTLLAPLTLWPASLVVLPGLVLAWQRRTEPAMKFLLAWAGATWFLFELTPTKLPHYVLPAVPALCLAAAAAFARRSLPAWSKAIWSLITVAVSGTVLWATQTYDGPVWLAVTGVALSIALIGWVWRQNTPPLRPVLAGAMLVFPLLVAGVLPRLDALSLSTRLRDAVALETVAPDLPVALARYHEPSAVFWMGTHTWLTNARNAAAHIIADPGALAVIAEDQLAEVSAIADAVGGTIVVLTTIDGYNYAKGRSENLILVRSEAKPSQP